MERNHAGRHAAVLTVSDRVSSGAAVDAAGPAIVQRLAEAGFVVGTTEVVADEQADVEAALARLAEGAALVVTTGGTGIAARDRTPEATIAVADFVVPGLGEEMRRRGRDHTPNAILSRGVAAVLGPSLVLNLPGSPKGAVESLEAVLP